MKDISVIFTGGTIGSTIKDDGSIGMVPGSEHEIIRMYEEEYGDAERFEFASPFTILSENLTPDNLKKLLNFLKTVDFKKYKGVIITHGTDTLSFTAAFLGTVLKDLIPCPVVLVGADRPPGERGSNAFANFDGAVKLIDFLSGSGFYNDVFVVWQKEGKYAAYPARELTEADSACDDFGVFGGKAFAEFYPEGLNMTGEGFSWKVVINSEHEERCLPVPDESKRRKIWDEGFDAKVRVLALRPYPGFSYADVDISKVEAVLVYAYHSATFCTGECGDVTDKAFTFQTLLDKCKKEGKRVYVASFKEDERNVYESVKDFGKDFIKLYDMSFEAAYINALLLESFA